MPNTADSISNTLAFFEGAVPAPSEQNLTTQMGVHFEEIAEMLQIQASTSRSQLVKARKMLQTQILELQKIAV